MTTPIRTSEAGGAHYHATKVTAKWAGFVAGLQAHATHTVAERARRDKDERQRDKYHQAEQSATNEGTA